VSWCLGVGKTIVTVVWFEYCFEFGLNIVHCLLNLFYDTTDIYSTTTFFINVIVCEEVFFAHYSGKFIAGEGITRESNVELATI